jgi:hypothetical protein
VDELDGILVGVMIAGLSVALLLVCHAVRALQEDVDLLRVTAAVPEIERHSG